MFTISFPFRKLHGFHWDTTIFSKKDPRNGSKEKRSYDKAKINKTMLKIVSFIRILYLKQQYSATSLQLKI